MDFGGIFYKALQQSGEWWEVWSSEEIKTENNNLSTHKSGSVNTGVQQKEPLADKNWICWLIKQSLWSICL